MGSVLSWLDSLWNFFSGGASSLWHWILQAFKSIWSWVYQAFDILERDIQSVASSLGNFARSVESWTVRAVDNLYHLAAAWVNDLKRWTVGEIIRISDYINGVYRWAIGEIDRAFRAIDNAINAVERWIISDIWRPLYGFISGAVRWIENEGAYVYDLISHPEKLVSLIESYLWSTWLKWLRKLAVPITAFIVQNFRNVIPELMSVAEDILTKIF